jgi:putative transposase
MPRPPRLNIPGYPQHIVQRGNNRQACFLQDFDYRLYLRLLNAACRRHQCALHAYVLMTNHVHLLLTPEIHDGVSLVVRDVGRDYVRIFNKAHDRTGTLWEGRFKSSLVDADSYCLACYRYIELNPVRAGMVRHPAEYRWSSYRANADGEPSRLLTAHPAWHALGPTDDGCRLAYRGLFSETLNPQQVEALRYGLRKGLPTGRDGFKRQIEHSLSVRLGDGRIGRPSTKG